MRKFLKISSSHALFILSVFFLHLLLYENDAYLFINSECPLDTVNIELVVQPETLDLIQVQEYTPSGNHNEESSPFNLSYQFNKEKIRLPFDDCQAVTITINQCPAFPNLQIISILQKKNHWHQSSDDEPSPHVCC